MLKERLVPKVLKVQFRVTQEDKELKVLKELKVRMLVPLILEPKELWDSKVHKDSQGLILKFQELKGRKVLKERLDHRVLKEPTQDTQVQLALRVLKDI